MNKTKEYVYEVSEQSTDTRYFEIVSDKKLTEEEINNAICLPNISKEGDCEKDGGITSTFKSSLLLIHFCPIITSSVLS